MDAQELSATYINRVPQSASTRHYIMKSLWQSDEISLQILDSHESEEWKGTISFNELKQSAEELEISYEKFFAECKEALTHNGGVDNFLYSISDNKFTLTKDDEFQIQYIEVNLRPTTDLQNNIAFTSADLIGSLRCELKAVQEESKDLSMKYQSMVNTLEKCLDEKNHLEKRLLRKFAVLLNSKKEKIAELQDLLVEKDNKLGEIGVCEIGRNKRRSSEMLESSHKNDDDFLQATQVLTQPVVTLPKRKKFNTDEESTTKPTKSITGAANKIDNAKINKSQNEANAELDSHDLIEEMFS